MHLTTHVLAGWCLAELAPSLSRREKAAIVIASCASDLDGLGLIAEMATQNSARPLLWWTDYHHVFGHNLAFATAACVIAALLYRRALTALLVFIAVHLHIFGDLIGSRGPDDYQWPIPYLYPLADGPQLVWPGQWYLNAWPNFVITAALIAIAMMLAWRRGYSIVGLFSTRADRAFIRALRARFH